MRIVKVFWGLDANLAYRRHFPAINWLTSYSLYRDRLEGWYTANVDPKWTEQTKEISRVLQAEAELDEIVKLVGVDALSPEDRLTLEVARSLREDFLQQDAFNPDDAYCSLQKQCDMVSLIFYFRAQALEALKKGADIEKIAVLDAREQIGRAKNVPEAEYKAVFAEIRGAIDRELAALV